MSRVVVAGGGVGGMVAARELRGRLAKDQTVTLVERNARHVFTPSLLWLMMGERRPEQPVRDISWLPRQGIEFVQEEIVSIDPETRTVATASREIQGDVLVVCLGAERTLDGLPGLKEAAHEFYTLEGAARLSGVLPGFRGGRVAIAVLRSPYSCPAAPYEAAFLFEEFLRKNKIEGEVAVYTPEPYPMPTAGPVIGGALREALEGRGIGFHPQVQVQAVNDRRLTLSDGSEAGFDLLVAIPFHQPPAAVRQSALAGPNGWVPVDPGTLATRHDRVFALGDVTALSLPGRFRPDVPLVLPKAGVFAHRQAEVVAENVAALLEGKEPSGSLFDGKGFCFVEMGEGRAGFGGGEFFATPEPRTFLRPAARQWHWGKDLFERTWLSWVEGKRSAEAINKLMASWAEKYL